MIHQADPFTEAEQAPRPRGPLRRMILGHAPVLPVLVTLCNGVAGFISIHYATKGGLRSATSGDLLVAAWLIFAAMFFDAMDGRIARMTRQATDFGAQLDSLCDAISFGVAPAVLMVHTVSQTNKEITGFEMFSAHASLGKLVLAIAVIYACCALLRLARFNVENAPDLLHHMGFRGLPSPAAAALVASVVLMVGWGPFEQKEWLQITVGIALPALTLAAALLMVSRFPYPHLVNRFLSRRKPFSTIVVVVVLLAAALMFMPTSLAVGTIVFATLGPATTLYRRLRPPATGEEEDQDID